jgi:predicted 3-demethylubiquinone-9 3-methyltransferase (glyoxalase superfamily)
LRDRIFGEVVARSRFCGWLRDRVFVVGWAIVFLWLVEAIALLRGMSGRSLFW